MTEEIIIDGVNVAGCGFRHKDTDNQCHIALAFSEDYGECWHCEQIENCYYKQLKRLEQENKQAHEDFICSDTALRIANTELDELKQENERLQSEIRQKKMIIMMNNDHYLTVGENNRKYRSALEEIRELLSPHCTQCSQVLDIINEVLGDET